MGSACCCRDDFGDTQVSEIVLQDALSCVLTRCDSQEIVIVVVGGN